jgi:hypothetical protein
MGDGIVARHEQMYQLKVTLARLMLYKPRYN